MTPLHQYADSRTFYQILMEYNISKGWWDSTNLSRLTQVRFYIPDSSLPPYSVLTDEPYEGCRNPASSFNDFKQDGQASGKNHPSHRQLFVNT